MNQTLCFCKQIFKASSASSSSLAFSPSLFINFAKWLLYKFLHCGRLLIYFGDVHMVVLKTISHIFWRHLTKKFKSQVAQQRLPEDSPWLPHAFQVVCANGSRSFCSKERANCFFGFIIVHFDNPVICNVWVGGFSK